VQALFAQALALIRKGKLRALGLTTAQRTAHGFGAFRACAFKN
jgi:hypothetical protein